jgi:diguanylate cyclase (GGDEF)-like protein/PAS domain S-box-containing protein
MNADGTGASASLISHRIWAPCLAGLCYFALASTMIHLTSHRVGIATIWPANALLLAMLLHQPRSQWRPMLLAAFIGNGVANILTRGTVPAALLFSIANMIEVVIAARGLHGTIRKDGMLGFPATVVRFLFWAGAIAPGVSAVCGSVTVWLLFDRPLVPAFQTWLLADSLGLLIFTPFLFHLIDGGYGRYFRAMPSSRRLEAAALLGMTVVVALFVFTQHYPLLFLLYMPTMLVAFRLEWPGTKLALMSVAIIGAAAVMLGMGPLAVLVPDPVVQAIGFQFFLAALLLTTYPVAAALAARRTLMQELRESEWSLRLLATQSPILLLNFDLSGVCRKVLGAPEMLLGRNTGSLLGHGFADISEEGNLLLRSAHERALDDPESVQKIEFRAFKVNQKWLEVTFRTTCDDQGRCLGTLATVHDITDRKQQQLTLARSAATDSLTGLLNRAGFLTRLEYALSNAEDGALSLALIDVDRFKLINDNAGHRAGDMVLKEIAARLGAEVRSGDAVGRLGGDEFVLLLATGDWNRVQKVCNRVVEAVRSEPIMLPSGASLRAAISCGVVQYKAGLSAEEFMHEADLVLYEAKRRGRDQVVAA